MADPASKFCYVFLTSPVQQVELHDHYCTQSVLQPVWKHWILILGQGSQYHLCNLMVILIFLKNFSKFTYLKVFLVQQITWYFLPHFFFGQPLQTDNQNWTVCLKVPMYSTILLCELHRGYLILQAGK